MSKSRKIRLYIEDTIELNCPIYLDQHQKNYLLNVMRCKDGEEIKVFNESSGEWIGVISVIKPSVTPVIKLRDAVLESNHKIVFAFAPTKKYGEFAVEKATEMGVSAIIPLKTHRSIVDKINCIRYRKAMIEAAEQCKRVDLPKLTEIIDLRNLKRQIHALYGEEEVLFIVCDLARAPVNFNCNQTKIICIIVGPEGGFGSADYEVFDQLSVKYLKLGENVLRAETASIASIAIIKSLL
jgi:16S rRNA (uracil1498-N3)-methyltransferase